MLVVTTAAELGAVMVRKMTASHTLLAALMSAALVELLTLSLQLPAVTLVALASLM